MRHFVVATVLAFGGMAPVTSADEPASDDQQFAEPSPRPVTSGFLPYYLPSSLPQPGTREIWQYYGVDSRGRWLPRVILSPAGAYSYHNGAPFPYTTTMPNLYMPYVVD